MTAATAPSTLPATDLRVVWYRGPEGDHAFYVGPGWMRSVCRAVRWTVLQSPVEGTVRPCTGCLAALAPVASPTELEQRASWGDR